MEHDRIRTSHVGRLPSPKGWEDMPGRLASAEITDPAVIAAQVTPAIAETARRQVEVAIDCIGDGEFWTARSLAHDTTHFTGIEARPVDQGEPPTTLRSTRERDEFPDFYADMDNAGTLFLVPGEKPMPPVTVRVGARSPVKSKGPEAINRQLDTFKAAISARVPPSRRPSSAVLAPGRLDHFIFNFARGISGGGRGRVRVANRRPRLARLVGHAEARTDDRGLIGRHPDRPVGRRRNDQLVLVFRKQRVVGIVHVVSPLSAGAECALSCLGYP